MRAFSAFFLALLGLGTASAQTCTGLCLQQTTCPAGQTTSMSGTVYTPNGIDPLPNVLVYIPNAPVATFTPGVSCPVPGTPPSGAPLVGTTTAVDGTFVLNDVPVGANIPLVIQTGRWRRQLTVPTTAACANTSFSTRMPRNQTEGDIPKFAIATGSADQVECVLRKVGVDDSEFTDPGGTGRINLFSGSGSPGARIDTATPSQTTLMNDATVLNSYDVLMLPCQGNQFIQPSSELANFINFANAGGRVYSSHYSYVWMYQNSPFSTIANWAPQQASPPDGVATVDTSFAEGQTLSKWLQIVGASTVPGQIPISTLKHDFNGVVTPNQSWLTLNNAQYGDPVMQFVFNAPVGSAANQCGRVLYNEYHVENPSGSPANKAFPAECPLTTAMTPQEKLLEFSLFELTSDGGQPTLTPPSLDFGLEPIGFSTASQPFLWTNNSTFPVAISVLNATGDFAITSNNCIIVAPGASCTINVDFTPTAIGQRTGSLTVGSAGLTITASLTGTGEADLVISPSALAFGNVDVTSSSTKLLTVTNSANGSVPIPPIVVTGQYTYTTTCGSALPALSSCSIAVTFAPTAPGPQAGTLALNSSSPAYTGTTVALTGNGVDFTIAVAPTSGSLIAGDGTSLNATVAPLAGFANPITLTCTTNAAASVCAIALGSFTPVTATSTAVSITTTARYTVIGFGGFGGNVLLSLLALGSTALLWFKRKQTTSLVSLTLTLLLLAAASLSLSGCSGKNPAQNAVYTLPGSYSYILTATDGILTHSATYSLKVTAN